MYCKRCNIEFSNKHVSKRFLKNNKDKYNYCSDCRKIKKCKSCENEFKHHQNQTCSKECAEYLKKISLIVSCGTTHNFNRNSTSREKWQKRIKEEEGIINVFQRDSVKKKIKETNIKKWGFENPSQNEEIKNKKLETFRETLFNNPGLLKKNWRAIHDRFMSEIGYDPRLHAIGKASKESLIIFKPLIDWCIEEGIEYSDIYIGYNEKNEYFIRYDNNKLFFYDFTIRSKKIIIEYNGVAFHPKLENKNWKNPFTNESHTECLEKDNLKINVAEKEGFDILIIWSDEDPILNLEYCKKFINRYENKKN